MAPGASRVNIHFDPFPLEAEFHDQLGDAGSKSDFAGHGFDARTDAEREKIADWIERLDEEQKRYLNWIDDIDRDFPGLVPAPEPDDDTSD